MNIIFFGNTKYSLIDAQALHEHFGLQAIVTIADRENKRKRLAIPSPTKAYAIEQKIPFIEANKITSDIIEQIKKMHPDFLVVADYGLILPQTILDIPKYAPLNIHHSLLPKYRGPAPVPSAILHGDTIAGVTIIKMNNKVDDGDILAQKEYQLHTDETTDSLLITLNKLGAQAVIDVIENFEKIKPEKQNVSRITLTKYMEKQDGYISVENPPTLDILDRMIRAYYPWPGVWTNLRLSYGGQAKEKIVKFLPNSMIQVEGKKPTEYKDFINGYPEGKEFLEKLGLI